MDAALPTADEPDRVVATPAPVAAAADGSRPRSIAGDVRSFIERLSPRKVVLAALCVLLVLGLWEALVSQVMHSQRQQHLAADFGAKRASASDGQAIAVLQIPTIGLNEVVSELATLRNLRGGPVHLSTSVRPGDLGTSVIFGKSSRYGAPFRRLDALKIGDLVAAQARASTSTTFKVTEIKRHVKTADAVITSDPSRRSLTLVTSENGLLDDDLVVVTATAQADVPSPDAASLGEPASYSLVMDRGSLLFGRPMLFAYLCAVLAFFVMAYLRPRYRRLSVIVACAPVVVASCALVLLELDRLLPPTH